MERTSTTQEAPGRRSRHLLAYCVGFILLTNALTIVFVLVLRSGASAPAPVMLQRVRPAAGDTPQQAAQLPVETRQVRVTSRPDGAVVSYQGQAQGTTPLSIALPAHAVGALELEKEGYRTRAVTVEAGQAEVHVRLVRARERRTGRSAERQVGTQAGEGDQAGAVPSDGAATQDPAARTPAASEPARSSPRRPPASGDPAPASEDGSRSSASPDSRAE